MPTITAYEMARRQLISQASSAILNTMDAFTESHDGLTAWEWLKAFRSVEDRIVAGGLMEDWKENQS